MNPLQYTSEEMFSSTELIRKSKNVFDKLQKQDIEKAIILRDGKPAFMLLDFSMYEDLMSEYLSLKELLENKKETQANIKREDKTASTEKNTNLSNKEIDEKELEEALAQIDDLDLDELETTHSTNIVEPEKEPLKDFWE